MLEVLIEMDIVEPKRMWLVKNWKKTNGDEI